MNLLTACKITAKEHSQKIMIFHLEQKLGIKEIFSQRLLHFIRQHSSTRAKVNRNIQSH